MLISMFEIHANQSAAKLFAVDQTLVCKIVFTIPETQDRYWKQKTKLQGKEVYFHSKHADNVCCLSLVAEKHHIVICWSENTNLNPKNILHWGQENVSWYQNEATHLSPYVWHISLWLLHVLLLHICYSNRDLTMQAEKSAGILSQLSRSMPQFFMGAFRVCLYHFLGAITCSPTRIKLIIKHFLWKIL